MIRFTYIFAAFCLLGIPLEAQVYNQLDTIEPIAYWGAEVKNDSFVVIGWVRDTIYTGKLHTHYTYYDDNGVIWNRELVVDSTESVSNISNFQKTSDGKYYHGTFNRDTSGYRFVLHHFVEDLLIDSVQYFSFPEIESYSGSPIFHDFKIIQDSILLVCGSIKDTEETLFHAFIGRGDLANATIDQVAIVAVPDSFLTTFRHIVPLSDSTVMVVARESKILDYVWGFFEDRLLLTIWRSDSLVLQKSLVSAGGSLGISTPIDAIRTGDGSYLIAAGEMTGVTGGQLAQLLKVNSELESVMWSRSFRHDGASGPGIYDIEEVGDGNYLACGTERRADSISPDSFYIINRARIIFFHESGVIHWEKTVSLWDVDRIEHRFTQVKHLKDSVYLFVGIIDSKWKIPGIDQPGWIYTLDLKDMTTSTTDQLVWEDKVDWLYPNPTSGILKIREDAGEWDQIIIYSVNGVLIKSITKTNGQSINIDEVAPGKYQALILKDRLIVGSEGIIKF